ncbi:hypothetical protein TWF718_002623 [Orbilia javanica]|uniref:Uncharacterized protein n=1 Tax=Orbilia javanica TaxID=47235 RepID=A0AAN8MRZ6_9PEZI
MVSVRVFVYALVGLSAYGANVLAAPVGLEARDAAAIGSANLKGLSILPKQAHDRLKREIGLNPNFKPKASTVLAARIAHQEIYASSSIDYDVATFILSAAFTPGTGGVVLSPEGAITIIPNLVTKL